MLGSNLCTSESADETESRILCNVIRNAVFPRNEKAVYREEEAALSEERV